MKNKYINSTQITLNLTNRKSIKMVIKHYFFDDNSIIDISLDFNGSSYTNISDINANFRI
jgi:hypothetical protein